MGEQSPGDASDSEESFLLVLLRPYEEDAGKSKMVFIALLKMCLDVEGGERKLPVPHPHLAHYSSSFPREMKKGR